MQNPHAITKVYQYVVHRSNFAAQQSNFDKKLLHPVEGGFRNRSGYYVQRPSLIVRHNHRLGLKLSGGANRSMRLRKRSFTRHNG